MSAWHDDPTNKPIPDDSRLMRQFPELAFFGSRDARARAWKVAVRRIKLYALLLILVIVFEINLFFGTRTHSRQSFSWASLSDWWPSGLLIVQMIMLCGLLVLIVRRRHRLIGQSLRKQLRLRRSLICRKCGYSLHGLTAPRCPECGTAFDPALLPHPPTEPPRP